MNSHVDFKEIAELDLEPVKKKLMHASGAGWTREQASTTEVEYRRFLDLMKNFPAEQTAPSVAVDTFWHYHILDTVKYAADCEHAFGYFLHHNPHVGMDGEDAGSEHRNSGERMRALYEQTFAVSYNPGAGFGGTVQAAVQDALGASVLFDKQSATAYCALGKLPSGTKGNAGWASAGASAAH